MRRETAAALVDALGGFERVVEVGIGNRHVVAAELASRGVDVLATDIHHRETPSSVDFTTDDLTDPDLSVYRDRELVYALNCPPDLHGALRSVAERVGAVAKFTTLGGDPPAVSAAPEQLPGETLFTVRTGRD